MVISLSEFVALTMMIEDGTASARGCRRVISGFGVSSGCENVVALHALLVSPYPPTVSNVPIGQ